MKTWHGYNTMYIQVDFPSHYTNGMFVLLSCKVPQIESIPHGRNKVESEYFLSYTEGHVGPEMMGSVSDSATDCATDSGKFSKCFVPQCPPP